jgi:2-alkyl-3-oxoalkanoate reductase
VAAGVRRFVAQSYTGWDNIRERGPVKTEDDPLDPSPPAAQRRTLAAIRHLERVVLGAAPMEGIVLRYGSFYGPGASDAFVEPIRKRKVPVIGDGAGIWSFLHISDAAAVAALGTARPASTTSSTTSPVAWRSGCRSWRRRSARRRRTGCRCGWGGWPPARWGSR